MCLWITFQIRIFSFLFWNSATCKSHNSPVQRNFIHLKIRQPKMCIVIITVIENNIAVFNSPVFQYTRNPRNRWCIFRNAYILFLKSFIQYCFYRTWEYAYKSYIIFQKYLFNSVIIVNSYEKFSGMNRLWLH